MAVLLSPVGGVAAQFFDNNGNPLSGGKLFSYSAGTTTPAVTYTNSLGTTAHTNPIVLDAGGRVPGGEIWLTDGVIYKFVLQTSTNVLIATYDNIVGINSNFVNYTASQEIQTATAGQTVFDLTTMQYQPSTNSLSVFVDGVNQYGPGAQYAYVETDSDTVTFVSGLHVGASVKFTTATQTTGNATNASVVAYTPHNWISATTVQSALDEIADDLSAASGSNLIGYLPVGTGAVVTTVQAKLRQVLSVMDFGAVTTPGVDNTAAFQAALDAAQAVAGAVYVPSGTYRINSQLLIGSNTRLYGAGMYRTILEAANTFTGDGLIKTNGAGGPPTIIEHMAILGQSGLGAGIGSVGINATVNAVLMHHLWVGGFTTQFAINGTDCHCTDCWADVALSAGYGFVITNGGNSLLDCTVYNCYTGIYIDATGYWSTTEPYSGVQINNMKIIACAYKGIDMVNAINVFINNLYIIANAVGNYSNGCIAINNCNNININQYTINFGTAKSTSAYGVIQTGYLYNSTLSNSSISGCLVGAQFDSPVGLVITGNQFFGNKLGGFKLIGSAGALSITGNTAQFNGDATSFAANTSYGFWVEHNASAATYAISGNSSLDYTSVQYYGFYLTHSGNTYKVAFTGNASTSDGSAYTYTGAGTANIINQATNA